MNAAQQRKAPRIVHLIAAVGIIAAVYGPAGAQLHDLVRFIILPVVALTGILMWQAPRIRKLRRRLSGRSIADLRA